MCAILDTNVIAEVISGKTEAGIKFKNWIESKRGRLVVGGKHLDEMIQVNNFDKWFSEIRRSGVVTQISNEVVCKSKQKLALRNDLKSNDSHVLALAKASGARLLYTNDKDLKKDFKNKNIISLPRGKIYTTAKIQGQIEEGRFRRAHRKLLENQNLCVR